MTGTAAAVLLSLASAVGYAAAAVVQERLAARSVSASPAGGPRSAAVGGRRALLRLLRRGTWWWAVALNAAGAALHVAALRFGPLTLVQPLGALTLVAAVPLGARYAHRRVAGPEWRGTAMTLLGLAGLLLIAGRVAPDGALDLGQSLAVTGTAAAVIALLGLPGTRAGHGSRRGTGLRHAVASGVASGIASALTQSLAVRLTGPGGRTDLWACGVMAVLVAVCAIGGLLLAQSAYRAGLGAPLALLTLANPAAAAVVGITLLGERFSGGVAGTAVAVVAALAAARGVVLLTRVPLVGTPGPPPGSVVARSSAPPPPAASGTPSGDRPLRTPR